MRPLQIPVFSMSFKSPVSLGANRSGQGTEARGIPVSQFAVESPGAQPLEKHLRMVVNATQMDFSLDEPSKPSLTMHDCSLVRKRHQMGGLVHPIGAMYDGVACRSVACPMSM